MAQIKKRKIPDAEIPSSSMADIAFLLLLFFLVSTVIDVDTGIGLTLPEYVPPSEQELAPIKKDRMAAIMINESGQVLLNDKVFEISDIKDNLTERIKSKIDLPKNKKLIVSVKVDRKTNYNLYIQALDQVKGAYFEVRDEYSESHFGKKTKDLDPENLKIVRERIPIIISIAEPESIKK